MKKNKGFYYIGFLLLVYIFMYTVFFHPEAENISASGKEKNLCKISEAIDIKNLKRSKFKNLDISQIKDDNPVSDVIEGEIFIRREYKEFAPYYEKFFKQRLKKVNMEYDKNNVVIASPKYLNQGYDYMVGEKMFLTMSEGGFIQDYGNKDEYLDTIHSKATDLLQVLKSEDRVVNEDFNEFVRDIGVKSDISYVPFSKTKYKSSSNDDSWEYIFRAAYKGNMIEESNFENSKYNKDPFPLSGSCEKYKSFNRYGVNAETAKVRPRKVIKRIISIKEASKLFSEKITDHKTYKVKSVGLVYLQEARKEKKDSVIIKIKPFWAFYIDKTQNKEIAGYVDVQTGEVIFVNKSM